MVFSPDGSRLASASGDHTVKLWDATSAQMSRFHMSELPNPLFPQADATGTQTLRFHKEINLRPHNVVFSPDGKRVASSCDNPSEIWVPTRLKAFLAVFAPPRQQVKVWDSASGQELLSLQGHTSWVPCVVFSPDGTRLASCSHDKTVKVWDASSGQELLSLQGHTGVVWGVAYSPDGKRLVSGSPSELKVWDAATGQELLTLKGTLGFANRVVFSPDGTRIATGSQDKVVKMWDAISGQELPPLVGHSGFVTGVVFSPDGKRIASSSLDMTVKLWDAASGKELLTLKGYTDTPSFTPDGTRLACVGGDRTIKLLDAATGQELLTLKGHPTPVTSVCFSLDGTRLASVCQETLKLWETAKGQDVRVLKGHTNPVTSISFSADGRRIVSHSAEIRGAAGSNTVIPAEVRSWDAGSGQPIEPCNDPAPTGGLAVLSPDGSLRATAVGNSIHVLRTADDRPSSDLVFLSRLNDEAARLRWHRHEADSSEKARQWFAAGFHLRQLLRRPACRCRATAATTETL